MAAHARLTVVEWIALVTVSCIAAGDLITYSTPGAFLGQALAAQGATPSQVMLAYGLSGAMTPVACVLVLLCQSHPSVAGLSRASKWGVVVVAQFLGAASSIIILVWPVTPAVIAARALHGTAAAGYLVYCLSLLVELSPKQHLATGNAAMAAGMTAGDSVAPVVGTIIYDRAGFRAAFLLPAAYGILVLLMALLMYPIWRWSPNNSKQPTHHRSYDSNSRLAELPQTWDDSKADDGPKDAAAHAATWALPPSQMDVAHPAQQSATTNLQSNFSKTISFSKGCSKSVTQMPPVKYDSNTSQGTYGFHKPCLTNVQSSNGSRSSTRQEQQEVGKLDFQSVADTVRDQVVFCQCVVLFLEQMVRAIITVVLPVTMGASMWLVGVVYVANVAGAVLSPFAVDYVINKVPKMPTQLLAAGLSLTMGISSILSVAFSTRIALLCVLLFVYGASQSAVGTLVYVHVAHRLDVIGHHTGLHVSMCMYVFADTAAGGVGNLTGGALQHQVWGIQVGVVALGAAIATFFGMAVGVISFMHEKQQKGAQVVEASQVIIA